MPAVISATSTVTVQDLMDETRRALYGGMQDQVNITVGGLTDSATTVEFADPIKAIARGSILEMGLESMYVRSTDEDLNTAEVIRGWGRSEALPHADASVVRLNPSYLEDDIFHAVSDEISSLNGTSLACFVQTEFTYCLGVDTYDSALGEFDPVRVYSARCESLRRSSVWTRAHVELMHLVDVDDFASGYAFRVVSGGIVGQPLQVIVMSRFATPSATTQTMDQLSIPDYVHPIVPVGAAWRLLLGKEARRVNPDGSHGSRRAEEVPPGSVSFLGRALQGQREALVGAAVERQMAQFPFVFQSPQVGPRSNQRSGWWR